MLKNFRLKQPSGHFEGDGKDVSDSVFERPVMLVYAGTFNSLDGEVEITPEHIDMMAESHNSFFSKLKRLATGDVPMKDCPPLQLDHSTSAAMTVGRLVGPLRVEEAEIDGKKLKALFGTARFLGKENVEKAKDGRYTHVSIGADLESGKINELSVTPFPAAPNASLLANGNAKEDDMKEKLKKHLMDSRKMSAEDADKKVDEMLKHHMAKMSLDEEGMKKHLEAADDAECKRMAEEYDEHEKKLAADKEEEEKKLAAEKEEAEKKLAAEKEEQDKKLAAEQTEKTTKLTAAKSSFVSLVKGMRKESSELNVALRKAIAGSTLARLRAESKITPAEIKKLDLVKLAELDEKSFEAAMATYESREPVIQFGTMRGTTKAEAIEKVTQKYRLAKLELESRLNMPSKKAEAEKQLGLLNTEEQREIADVKAQVEEPTKGMLERLSYDQLAAMVDRQDQHEDLKRHLKRLLEEHEGREQVVEGDDKRMSALAKKHSALQTQLKELIEVASPALGIGSEELN